MHSDFASRLRPLVDAYGGPTKAAPLLGVTRQTINLWLRSKDNPSLATQAGALALLTAAPKKKENKTPISVD